MRRSLWKSMHYAIFIVIILLSSWTWKILQFNFFIFLVVFLSTFILLVKINRKEFSWGIVIIVFLLLSLLQYKTTNIESLTKLSDVQKTVQTMRMREYPHPRIAHIIEERPESIAFFRIEKNLFDTLDPNLFFFANHPRARVGFDEFEKFSFILIPFFVIGVFYLLKKGKSKEVAFSFLVPLLLLSFIGHQNPIGPFSLLPFFVVVITWGVYYAIYKD